MFVELTLPLEPGVALVAELTGVQLRSSLGVDTDSTLEEINK